MIIDSHQHVFWHGRDHHGLIADMDEQQIDQAWLLSWEIAPEEDALRYHPVLNPLHIRPDGTHAGIAFADLLRARDEYPQRFIPGYCPHPLKGDAPGLFEAACRIHGVRVCGEWKFRIPFDDPRCLNLFWKAGELGCPVVFHLDIPFVTDAASGKRRYLPSWYGGTVANLERALQACPETTFIGHAPGFWREISGDADQCTEGYPSGPVTPGGRLYRLFDTYPNLYADISAGSGHTAISRDLEHGRAFMKRYSDRLLFGRDYYGGKWGELVETIGLDDAAKARIYNGNALQLVPPR